MEVVLLFKFSSVPTEKIPALGGIFSILQVNL